MPTSGGSFSYFKNEDGGGIHLDVKTGVLVAFLLICFTYLGMRLWLCLNQTTVTVKRTVHPPKTSRMYT